MVVLHIDAAIGQGQLDSTLHHVESAEPPQGSRSRVRTVTTGVASLLAVAAALALVACGAATVDPPAPEPTPARSHGSVRMEDGDAIGGCGTIDSAIVVGVLRDHLREVEDCYREELARDPTLHGRVDVEFTVEFTGEASHVSARSNGIGDASVASCVSHMVTGLHFPRPLDCEVRFTYPYVFTP